MSENSKFEVLVIEDATAVAEYLVGFILELWGITPVVFPIGEPALRYLEDKQEKGLPLPQLFIIDLQLPRDPQGMEILRKIKSDPAFSASQVIIHTGFDDLKNKLEINQMSNVKFVRKGLGHNGLIEVLTKMKAAGFPFGK